MEIFFSVILLIVYEYEQSKTGDVNSFSNDECSDREILFLITEIERIIFSVS